MKSTSIFILAALMVSQTTEAVEIHQRNANSMHQKDTWWGSAKDDEEEDHSKEYFRAEESVTDEDLVVGIYSRIIPVQYDGPNADIFMKSMIENYALEQKTKKGDPSGTFWMDQDAAKAAAQEVLETHKGLTGKMLSDYVRTYFDKTWAHFDVNQTGYIEVSKMPQFMRFIASDQNMSLLPY